MSLRDPVALERQKGPPASQVVFLNKSDWSTIGDDPKASLSDAI